MSISKLFFLITFSLLVSVGEYPLLPYMGTFFDRVLLIFSISFAFLLLGRFHESMIISLFGGLFEGFLGVRSPGLYATFYCCVIFTTNIVKKHITSNPIVLVVPYVLAVSAFLIFSQGVFISELFSSVLGNLLFLIVLLLIGRKITHEE